MLDTLALGARCGFITPQMWIECVCSDVKQARRYGRLAMLRRRDILENANLYSPSFKVFRLSDVGKRIARRRGHKVFEEPSEAVIFDQEAAYLLGHRLTKQNLVNAFFTKRDINRSPDLLEKFNGRNLRNVLPDLVLELQSPQGAVFVAVELEGRRNSPEGYRNFVRKYEEFENINSILILSRFELKDKMRWAQKQIEYSSSNATMHFGDVDEFLKRPATEIIESIDGVTTFKNIVLQIAEQRTQPLSLEEIEKWKNNRQHGRFDNGQISTLIKGFRAG